MVLSGRAIAHLLTRRVSTMMLSAAGFGLLSSYLGLLTSYHFDVAAGASIVFTAVYLFVVVAILTIPRRIRGHHELPHQHEHSH